jgi:hypothetical protein
MSDSETAETLEAAADYIDVHGWCQRDWITPTGQVCLDMALSEVTDHVSHCLDARNALIRYLKDIGVNPPSYMNFNDMPGRTQGEVTDLLRTVAKQLREDI